MTYQSTDVLPQMSYKGRNYQAGGGTVKHQMLEDSPELFGDGSNMNDDVVL